MKRILFIFFIFLFSCGFSSVREVNPDFISYNKLSEEEKKEVSYIPNPFVYYASFEEKNMISPKKSSSKLFKVGVPSSYDLRTVGGSPELEDQDNLGLCWAFSAYYCLNSYSLMHDRETFNYSKNQLDYVANYLEDSSSFGSGNNFFNTSKYWTFGYGPMTEEHFGSYFQSYKEKDISSYMDTSYSNVDVTGTRHFLQYDVDALLDLNYSWTFVNTLFNEMNSIIKNHIMTNGAVTSAVYWYFYDENTNLLYNDGSGCSYYCLTTAHATTIIGWDDNYETGVTIRGNKANGAWIAMNTWGETYSYYYIPYYDETVLSNMFGITEVKDKTWDKSYSNAILNGYDETSASYVFYKGASEEKVEELKIFYFGDYYRDEDRLIFDVEVCDSKKCVSANEKHESHIGMVTYTFDDFVTDESVVRVNIDNHDSSLYYPDPDYPDYFEDNNNLYFNYYISLFSSSTSSDKKLYVMGDVSEFDNETGSRFEYYLITKNILSDTPYTIEFTDENGNDLSSHFDLGTPGLLNGYAEAIVELKERLDPCILTIKFTVDGISEEYKYVLYDVGTEENPIVIDDASFLENYLSDNKYYVLGKNIDLSIYTGEKNGEAYNNGEGWNGKDFSGTLDGRGYTISGLNSKTSGLFDNFSGTIKNIKLSGFNLEVNEGYAGVIANESSGNVENVSIENSFVSSNYSGGLFGKVTGGNISNVYLGANIFGNLMSGGLAGYVSPSKEINVNNVFLNEYTVSTLDNGIAGYIAGKIDVMTANYVHRFTNIKTNLIKTNNKNATYYTGEINNNTEYDDLYLFTNIVILQNNTDLSNIEEISVSNFENYDFDSYWVFEENSAYLKLFNKPDNVVDISLSYNGRILDPLEPIVIPRGVVSHWFVDKIIVPEGVSYEFFDNTGLWDTKYIGTGGYIFLDNKYDSKIYRFIVKGDGNGDGEVKLDDVIMGADASIEIFENPDVLTDLEFIAFDITKDGYVNINDIIEIANASLDPNYDLN